MRPGQQNKRSRGRSSGGGSNNNNNNNNNNYNRKGSNPLTRTYDSSGPDVKIRGTAQNVAEKYTQLARDAHSSGDRVMAENYLQHAEHYNRIIATAQAQMQERVQRDDRGEPQDRDMDRDGDDFEMDDRGYNPQPVEIAGSGPQPVIPEAPAEVAAAAEESAEAVAGAERGPSRRRAASNRPRRTRRGSDEQAEGGDASSGSEGGEPPVLETVSE